MPAPLAARKELSGKALLMVPSCPKRATPLMRIQLLPPSTEAYTSFSFPVGPVLAVSDPSYINSQLGPVVPEDMSVGLIYVVGWLISRRAG